MILNYQKWLPHNAILDGKLEKIFQDVEERWAAKWFSGSTNFSAQLVSELGDEYIYETASIWKNEIEDISVAIKASSIPVLAQNLLNQDFSLANICDADELLFESLSKECMKDFQSALCKEFLLDSEFVSVNHGDVQLVAEDADYFLMITDSTNSLEIMVTFTKGFLTAARKASLGPDTSLHVLGEIEDAISKHIISLGARVGTSTINLLDIENLTNGDVIVLNNDITEPIDMTVNKTVIAGMKCRVQQDSKTNNLKIAQIMMDEV